MQPKLELQVAVEKINKYASSESGDTVEMVERPHGGVSFVIADGQRSGRSAKTISNIVVRKAISLIAEGVRDGAVARATHDYLLTHRGGRVSAELHIVSMDLVTQTLVISRNARSPMLVRRQDEFEWLDNTSEAIGIYRNTKPAITEMNIAPMTLVAVTDGIWSAGDVGGKTIDLPSLLAATDPVHSAPAGAIAAAILSETLRLDHDRPRDDATVLVVKIMERTGDDNIRRMAVRFPIF